MYPPALLGGKSEATGISVEQIRRIVLPRVGMRPHEARSLVFIVHAADELTSGAANALLKTLEEPRSGVHFILLTDRPAKMLDTILSRTLAVRFGPLPDEVLQTLLKQEGLDPELALLSQGSLEKARFLSEPEARAAREQFVEAMDNAITSGKVSEALRFADGRPEDRHDLIDVLGHAASTYATRARQGQQIGKWAGLHKEISDAIVEVERNTSPALVLESLVCRMFKYCHPPQ
jgi:DNA polymerase-3 subunit delta'